MARLNKDRQLAARVTAPLFDAFEAAADAEGKSPSEVLRELAEGYVKKHQRVRVNAG